MYLLNKQLERSPIGARVVPFVLFVLALGPQDWFGQENRYWFYLLRTLIGAWMLWETWPLVAEMRWVISWEAIVVGIGVCVMWVALDPFYPHLSEMLVKVHLSKEVGPPPVPWNPFVQFGQSSGLAWFFIAVRITGMSLVVPPLEEVFYRSFLYRYIAKPDFESVPLGAFLWVPFLVTSVIFGFEHHQWLAGVLCGFAFQGLVIWKKRLGDAMVAHAITNFLLGIWVVWKGDWKFF